MCISTYFSPQRIACWDGIRDLHWLYNTIANTAIIAFAYSIIISNHGSSARCADTETTNAIIIVFVVKVGKGYSTFAGAGWTAPCIGCLADGSASSLINNKGTYSHGKCSGNRPHFLLYVFAVVGRLRVLAISIGIGRRYLCFSWGTIIGRLRIAAHRTK